MAVVEHIIAGDNIHLERKHNDVIIHCSHMPAPVANLHSGFFKLKSTPENDSLLGVTISDCIFRLNGKYMQIDDYKIDTYYKYNLIFLQLDHRPEYCRITRYVYHKEEDIDLQVDQAKMFLLYKLTVINNRLSVESYAAGGLIDTVLPGEGFVYTLRDGSIKTTVTRTSYGDENEFYSQNAGFYIPSFNPVNGEGVNIAVPFKGGALAAGKDGKYYSWTSSGFPSSWGETYTVKVNPEKIYI